MNRGAANRTFNCQGDGYPEDVDWGTDKITQQFEKRLREKGLEAAISTLDQGFEQILRHEGMQRAVSGRRQIKDVLEAELKRVHQALAEVDRQFTKAFRHVGMEAGIFGDDDAGRSLSHADWILAVIRGQGGSVYGPDLYDLAEEQGRNRQSIYTTVSRLISQGTIQKRKEPGEKGSHLTV